MTNTPLWPHQYEPSSTSDGDLVHRSFRRRLFLVLTKPASSVVAFFFFGCIMSLITVAIFIMMAQTVAAFEESPESCYVCEHDWNGTADTDTLRSSDMGYDEPVLPVECVCEPRPWQILVDMEDIIYYVFTAEYALRFLTFSPLPKSCGGSRSSYFYQLLKFMVHPWQLIDLLAILPFWLEMVVSVSSFSSLRIVRLTRVFQVMKLGKYNRT